MLSWSFVPDKWTFDVASLMVLVGEDEERSYRLSDRSLLEAMSAAPVIGLQSYIKSYSFLLDGGPYTYFSPYGCKSAPLRNARLDKIISLRKLLQDGQYNNFRILDNPKKKALRKVLVWTFLWTIFTWICFAGIVVFLLLVGDTTWIGFANCIALSGWSIVLRAIEHYLVKPADVLEGTVSEPDADGAVFILGRNRSALVLEGTRKQLKDWLSRGLVYDGKAKHPPPPENDGESKLPTRAGLCQFFTRLVTFMVVMFVFITIPNGTTIDQAGFVLLNVLGQANVLVGRVLNCQGLFAYLEPTGESLQNVPSRTHINALLLRKFHESSGCNMKWDEAANLLPATVVWERWRQRVVTTDRGTDAKELYNAIKEEIKRK